MDGDLYIWMQRELPGRKGGEAGPWRPVFGHSPAPSREALRAYVDAHNEAGKPYPAAYHGGGRRAEHAIFRVPVAALEKVYPED